MRHFLSWANRFMDVNYRRKRFLDVNSKNLEDKTAWDMLQEDNKEIRVMLRRVGAKPCSSLSTFVKYPNPKYQRLSTPLCVHFIWIKNLRREIRKATEERRSMLLVVAALLATLSFQAVLTPPAGVWQENGLCITTEAGSSYDQIPPFNQTVGSSNYPQIIYLSQSNITLACEHIAGTAIALEDPLFVLFLICNTVLFSLSTSLIVLFILNLYLKSMFFTLNIHLCLSYLYSVWTITGTLVLTTPLVLGVVICIVLIQLLSWRLRSDSV